PERCSVISRIRSFRYWSKRRRNFVDSPLVHVRRTLRVWFRSRVKRKTTYISLTHLTLTIERNENESQCLVNRVAVEVLFFGELNRSPKTLQCLSIRNSPEVAV